MKTTSKKCDRWQVTSGRMKDAARSCHTSPLDFGHLTPTFSPLGAEREKTPVTPHVSRFKFHVSGFTLIELLVVIAIMAALAALLLPVARAVKKHQYIYNAQAELAKLETAIDRYKAAYGFYPPDNHLTNSAAQALVNQLYYELVGTTNNAATGADPNYHPLDGQGQDLSGANVSQAFGVGGFMNCGKSGGGEDASVAKDFLPDLKQRQIGVVTNSAGGGGNAVGVTVLITAVGGPDTTYQPLGAQDLNPWRYISSNPTNNPGSYDLWVLLSIGATTNLNTHTYGPLYLICNWSKSVQVVNSPVP